MSDASTPQPRTPHSAESPEFDFGPFKGEIVRIWGDITRLKSGHSQEDHRPEIEAKHDEIVRLSAETLIASGGEIEEPYSFSKPSKGIFKALNEACIEASRANPTYLMPPQSLELTFARRIAAEAVKILLARQKASEEPALDPEVAEVVAATKGDTGDATE